MEQAQDEVERCHEQIARQAQQNAGNRAENERLREEIEDMVVEQQRLMQRHAEQGAHYERRIEALSGEL